MSRLDRDAARKVLRKASGDPFGGHRFDEELDALEACVFSDPIQTVDRDALLALVHADAPSAGHERDTRLTDAVLALLRPVDGVTLNGEEAALAAEELRDAAAGWTASDEHDRAGACDALASKLEAAS